MSNNTILIKRRLPDSPLGTQIPTLSNGELGFNEVNSVLYYGASAGTLSIGGSGAFVDRVTDQTISGNKTFFGNVSATGPVTIDLSTAVNTTSSFVVENAGKLEKRFLDLSVVPQFTFTKNLTVSMDPAKSFGRYRNLDIIESIGKTVPQVLEMVVVEPIPPGIFLTVTSSLIPFNQTEGITNILTFNHNISSLGQQTQTARFEWRRGTSPATPWVELSSTLQRFGTLTHVITSDPFDINVFSYRYIVADTLNASATATASRSFQPYAPPSVSYTSPAANTRRDKGDITTTVTGTITRNSPNVPLSAIQLQRNVDNTGWTNVGPVTGFNTNVANYAFSHTDNSASINASSIIYRLSSSDAFQGNILSNSNTVQLLHRNVILYSSNTSITLADIYNAPLTSHTNSTQPSAVLLDENFTTRTINGVTAGFDSTGNKRYAYYCYGPSTGGNLVAITQLPNTPILDSFITLPGITPVSPTIISGVHPTNGANVSYKIYKTNSPGALTDVNLKFDR